MVSLKVLLACVTGWAVSAILTLAGVLSDDPKSDEFYARTDSRLYVIEQTEWFLLPYPGQCLQTQMENHGTLTYKTITCIALLNI